MGVIQRSSRFKSNTLWGIIIHVIGQNVSVINIHCGPLHYRKVSDDLPFLDCLWCNFYTRERGKEYSHERKHWCCCFLHTCWLAVYFNQMNTRFIKVLPFGLFEWKYLSIYWQHKDKTIEGVAVVQWVGHGSFNREVPCSIPGGLRWCQEGHPTSNAPVPH